MTLLHRRALLGASALAASLPGAKPSRAAPADALTARLDALLNGLVEPGGPGLAVAVSQGGRRIYRGFFGLADLDNAVAITPDTCFHVASLSKQFTAFAIARLEQRGQVDPRADIRAYLPELPDFGATVRVEHLVHHTSGLKDQWALLTLAGRDWRDVLTQEQVLALVSAVSELDFAPGSTYSYSNTNYTLLAEIVRRVTGQTLRAFLQSDVFAPLSMDHSVVYDDVAEVLPNRAQSYYRDDPAGPWRRYILSYDTVGATSLHTTVDDLLAWGDNLARPKVGDAALIRRITTPGKVNDGAPIAYAYGLIRDAIAGREAFVHSGNDAAFYAYFAWFPKDDVVIAITANTRLDPKTVCVAVARLVFGGDGVLAAKIAETEQPAPDELAGLYVGGPQDACMVVAKTRAGLEWRGLTRTSGAALGRRADGQIAQRTADITYRPLRGSNGALTGLEELDRSNPLYPDRRLYQRMPPGELTDAMALFLVGRWRSRQLDVSYELSLVDGQIVARDLWGARRARFVPAGPDRLESADGVLRTLKIVHVAGRPAWITLGAGRARHLRFDRDL